MTNHRFISGVSQPLAKSEITKQLNASLGKGLRIIPEEQFVTVTHVKSFGAESGCGDRFSVGGRLDDLDPRSAAPKKRRIGSDTTGRRLLIVIEFGIVTTPGSLHRPER
jgi:hypothetical protein